MASSRSAKPPSSTPTSGRQHAVRPLPPEALCTRCTLDQLKFKTTDDLEDGTEFIGQERPIAAIELGVSIGREGYNIFALGPSGTGKYTVVQHYVEQRAAAEAPPDDWCYVNNFAEPSMPHALRLPAGKGKELRRDMRRLVQELRSGLSSAFESDEYATRRRALEEEFEGRSKASLEELQGQAKQHGLTLMSAPSGLGVVPLKDGQVLQPEDFQKLPEEEQKRLEAEMESFQGELQKVMLRMPRWKREFQQRLRQVNDEVTGLVVEDLVDDLLAKYKDLADVVAYLQAVQASVAEHLKDFLEAGEEEPGGGSGTGGGDDDGAGDDGGSGGGESGGESGGGSGGGDGSAASGGGPAAAPITELIGRPNALRRYEVNVVVDSSGGTGAPVIYESNPSVANLVGRIEQMPMLGALITDFTLVRPGVLHRANGGYLIMDALKVLSSPYAWEALKRALQFQQVRIESPAQTLGFGTMTLEPEPIPLNVKVILMGDRQLYYLLAQSDPDFNELFKVAADFDDDFARDEKTTAQYARLIAAMVRREGLLPLDRSAVCRVVEHAARLVEDSERVTAQMRTILDLLQEADHWARREKSQPKKAKLVSASHVQQAIDAQIYRSDRVRTRMRDDMLRQTILVDTEGAKVGQVNGLSVLSLGTFSFGQPSRITAKVHMGRGEVIDIEREVELGGPLHSKGVLILSGFLRGRYAQEHALSLGASLVFEQSYGGVDGDSASSAELYALLSAIAGAPVKQSFAVTGSVNQSGEVQAIGGVNEKIEGFFGLCEARGLTGDQGVLIPASNVKHLMLRQDVVDAVAAGRFAVYPITTIDEGIAVLTGLAAGEPDAEGRYPEGTVNRMVADRLAELAERSDAARKSAAPEAEAKPRRARRGTSRSGG